MPLTFCSGATLHISRSYTFRCSFPPAGANSTSIRFSLLPQFYCANFPLEDPGKGQSASDDVLRKRLPGLDI